MPLAEYESTPREVRQFAYVQIGLTSGFVLLLFLALGRLDGDLPPWWAFVVLVGAVVVAAVLAERVWLQSEPFSPDDDPDELLDRAVGVFAAQTVRKLVICEAAVVLAIAFAFVGGWAAWPLVIGGVPGLALLAFEIWPSVRNLSITAAMLEAEGARTGLVEGFRSW